MRIGVYRTYNFIDKDPAIDALRTVIADEGIKQKHVHELSGVAETTLYNWFEGETRQPKNATLAAVSSALGYVRRDYLTKDGQVHIGYVKEKDLDYEKELTKAADWLIRQNTRKKRRSRKKSNGKHHNGNGHA